MKLTLPVGAVEDLGGNKVRVTLPGAPGIVVTATRIISAETTLDDATVLAAEILTADVGSLVSGTAIPAGATIVSVVDGVSFELSDVATETLADIVRVTEPDPGAIGANRLWMRYEPLADGALSIRNAADTGWIALGPAYYDANGSLYATVVGDGTALITTRFGPNGITLSAVTVGGGLSLKQYDAAGAEVAAVVFAPDGGITATGTAFTWNGDQIAVVP